MRISVSLDSLLFHMVLEHIFSLAKQKFSLDFLDFIGFSWLQTHQVHLLLHLHQLEVQLWQMNLLITPFSYQQMKILVWFLHLSLSLVLRTTWPGRDLCFWHWVLEISLDLSIVRFQNQIQPYPCSIPGIGATLRSYHSWPIHSVLILRLVLYTSIQQEICGLISRIGYLRTTLQDCLSFKRRFHIWFKDHSWWVLTSPNSRLYGMSLWIINLLQCAIVLVFVVLSHLSYLHSIKNTFFDF